MTENWRSLNAYTEAIDALLLKVIGPYLDAHAAGLEQAFWERHYAGGSHVRIRLRAPPNLLDELVAELRARTEAWLRAHPTQPRPYSAVRAAELLRAEGVDPATEDLEHRQSVVTEGRYPEPGKAFASPGARRLAERFRQASGHIALAILRDSEPRTEAVYRLFLALALHVGRGSYPRGAISFKSHWENYAAGLPETLVVRIRASYEQHREQLLRILADVEDAWRAGFGGNSPVASWWRAMATAHAETGAMLERGEALISPLTREEVAAMRERRVALRKRWSSFLDAQWANEEFLTRAQEDARSLRPRALVNFLYDVVAAVGMNAADRIAICHHTCRAIEEARGCNLDDFLSHNIAAVLERRRGLPADSVHPASAPPPELEKPIPFRS